MESRGWEFSSSLDDAAAMFMKVVFSRPSRFAAKFAENAFLTERVIKIIRGVEPAGEAFKSILGKFPQPRLLPTMFNDDVGLNIISNIMVELFSESNPLNSKKVGAPLGDLAIELVCLLTGIDTPRLTGLLANPLLHAYGSIEEQYTQLSKLARRIDTVEQGNWPLLLKAMTVPLSDEVFTDRMENVESLGCAKVGRKVVERLTVLNQYPQLLG